MSLKTEAIKRFLTAARSLASQGMSKEAIMQFAKNEFGEITELFQKQIDNIFKRPASGIEKIKIKDEVFDDTVIKLPYDDQLQPFNPNNPLKQYGKPKQNRPDVYGIDDYDTTNMSDIKKQIIRTETKLGNLNPDSPDFKERAKVLIDEIEELKSKIPRTDKYTGGIVDVEPNLSDIGHGSDALMARTRLMSPGSQATTSTGLNYLLAEDNDNIRIPFSKGKIADAARRKFLRLAGTGIGGLAALKAGLINLAKDAAPKVEMVKETVSQTPDYFFDLVSKIKMFGKEGTPISERMNVTNYKNFELTEDIATGDMRITKQAGDPDAPGYREEVMEYSKGGNPMEEGVTVERYEEATLFPDMDGKMKDIEDGIEPDSIKEIMEEITDFKKAQGGRIGFANGTDKNTRGFQNKYVQAAIKLASDKNIDIGDAMMITSDEDFDIDSMEYKGSSKGILEILNKKAEGGRIGYSKGKLVFENAARFLEKIFGKESMAEMPSRDPEMFQGLLEVVDMFRKRDKEGLIKYMRKFLPHKNDAEIEEFIIGSDGIDDIQGQLIRLGSGRDYKAKIDMINEASKNRKLADLEVTEEMKRKPNASGGIAKLLGE